MADSQAKCTARGGTWDPVNNRCSIPEGETSQGTLPKLPPTTPREVEAQQREAAAIAETEARKDKTAVETAKDQPITTEIETIPTPTGTKEGGPTQDGRGVGIGTQKGVPGVWENGVFFADEPKKGPQQVIFDEAGNATGIVQPSGQALTGLSSADIDAILQGGAVAADIQQQPTLAGQIGQFGQLGVEGTPFDNTALAGAAARGVIPGLIRGVGTGVATGLLGAKAGALGGPATAITLGALGFASGIASSILGEMGGQRTDNTNAQQRVLDEGKQVLSDWVTFAEANPSQKELALSGFNKQLALIDQAYRQMKLDTSQDVLAFENAIPNLAEFVAFYSASGERDVYSDEMRIAMTQVAPIDTRMLALINRRAK